MKARSLRSISLLVILGGMISTVPILAQSGAKGGGIKLLELGGKRPAVVAAEHVEKPKITCPQCKLEFKVVTERENKARVVRSVPVAEHKCPGCKTSSKLVGHGKAKVEKWLHVCSIAGDKGVCCAR